MLRQDCARRRRVQAICVSSIAHGVGYQHAGQKPPALTRARRVSRLAHLAVTFCRCMNIPARYCTGYLGTSAYRRPRSDGFQRLVSVFLGGRWHTFDARHNTHASVACWRVPCAADGYQHDVRSNTSNGRCRTDEVARPIRRRPITNWSARHTPVALLGRVAGRAKRRLAAKRALPSQIPCARHRPRLTATGEPSGNAATAL